MLTIRNEQLKAIQAKVIERFEDARLADIVRRFPKRYSALRDDGTRAVIRSGIRVAGELDIHGARDVRNLIDLMIRFGEYFHEKPELSFATAPLRNVSLPADTRILLTFSRMGVEPGFHE